jgi:peptidoglycan/LPS O-acetylase OafA/YrhL
VGGFSYALCAIHTPVLYFGHVLAEMGPEQSCKPPMLPLFALACGAAVAYAYAEDRLVRPTLIGRIAAATSLESGSLS